MGPRGAAHADGHVCICHLHVRMSWRHAPLPSPSACILFFLQRKSGQAGRKSTGGVPAAAAGLGQRRQGTLLHTCPTRQVRPPGLPGAARAPATAEQEPLARGDPPSDSFILRGAAVGERGDTSEGCGAWEVTWAGEDPKSKHCPSQVDFPRPGISPSTQLISSQHCTAIKVINAGAVRSPAPCVAARICRK